MLKFLLKLIKTNKAIAKLLNVILFLLNKSLKIEIQYSKKYSDQQQYLFAFWHGQQLLPLILCTDHKSPSAALVSPSKDGEILEYLLTKRNFKVIRGSSRRNNVGSLKSMLTALKQGYSLGFGVDGPIGPIHKIKPGIVHMAQKSQIPILPIGSAYENKFILPKTWDRFEIPVPFTKAKICVGDPIYINKNTKIESAILILEQELSNLCQKAKTNY